MPDKSKSSPSTVNKSAKDGRFVSDAKVKSSPSTTYKQTVNTPTSSKKK